MSRLRKWWRPAALFVAIVIVSQVGVSLLVRTHRVHAYLVRHLERAFGRPVEVSHFSVLILPTPSLDAEQITVGEDPAFGNEYFLRAERLSASLRWTGFLRGRFRIRDAVAEPAEFESGAKSAKDAGIWSAGCRQRRSMCRADCRRSTTWRASLGTPAESSDADRHRRWARQFQDHR